MYRKLIHSLGLILLIGMVSCNNEVQYSKGDIEGRWEVFQGERNGKPTQTLNGAYFEFMPNNQLATNVLGESQITGYNLYGKEIVQQGGEKIRYKIEALDDSKMTLTASIQGVEFVLDMIKSSNL